MCENSEFEILIIIPHAGMNAIAKIVMHKKDPFYIWFKTSILN